MFHDKKTPGRDAARSRGVGAGLVAFHSERVIVFMGGWHQRASGKSSASRVELSVSVASKS